MGRGRVSGPCVLMLDLILIRQHLRLEADETDEDTLLTAYGRAAWKLIENRTGRALLVTAPVPDDSPEGAMVVDDDLRLAMLLLVGHWFKHREAVTEATSSGSVALPLAVDALVGPYRWYHL